MVKDLQNEIEQSIKETEDANKEIARLTRYR